jgi:hypothetical protein
VVGAAFDIRGGGSDRASIDQAEVRLRSMDSPLSRRGSSVIASQIGSAAGRVGFSPLALGNEAQLMEDDFAFEGEKYPILVFRSSVFTSCHSSR